MKATRLALAVCSVVVLSPAVAAGDPVVPTVLASRAIFSNWSASGPAIVNPDDPGEFVLALGFELDGAPRLFNAPLTSGGTLRATAASDAAFPTAAALLTNGVNDMLLHGFIFRDGVSSVVGEFDMEMFPTLGPLHTITAITVMLSELEIQATTSDRAVRYRGILAVEGFAPAAPVPEPSTILLVGAGALAAIRRIRRRVAA